MSDATHSDVKRIKPSRIAQTFWDIEEQQEEQILHRVKQNLLEQYRHSEEKQKSSSFFALRPQFALAMLCLIIAPSSWLLWKEIQSQEPRLQMLGNIQAKKQTAPSTTQSFRISIPKGNKGTGNLQVKGYWKLKASGGTQFKIAAHSPKNSSLELKQGSIKVHVRPNTMDNFSVTHKNYQVVVKGTVFSVECTQKWMRVEVWRGKVQLRYRGKHAFYLETGHGVRLNADQSQKQYYTLPPNIQKPKQLQDDYEQMWGWLAQKHPSQFVQYVLDLSRNQRFSPSTRIELLQQAAQAIRSNPSKEWIVQKRIKVLAVQNKDYDNNDIASFRMTKIQCKLKPKKCARYYKNYLRFFKHGMYREVAYISLIKQAFLDRKFRRTIRWIKKYRRSYPKGTYIVDSRHILKQIKAQ